MKEYIKNCLHYLQLVFPLFILLFLLSVLFNFMSLVGIDLKDQVVSSIIRPCLFFSLYLSAILSCLIYGIFYIKKIQRFVIPGFLFPIFFTTLVIGLVSFFLKPQAKDAYFLHQADARLYLTEKTFIKYNQDIPPVLETEEYNRLLTGAFNDEQKTVLRSSFLTDKNQTRYVLVEDLNFQKKKKLQSVIYSITNSQPTFFYFNRVNKDSVENLVVIKDKKLSFFKKVEVGFKKDELIIRLPRDAGLEREFSGGQPLEIVEDNDFFSGRTTDATADRDFTKVRPRGESGSGQKDGMADRGSRVFTFIKLEFLNDTIFDMLGLKLLYDRFKNALSPFFFYKGDIMSLIQILVLWMIWCFIILSASNFVSIKQYLLMSLAINLCIFTGIFFLLEWIYPFYKQVFDYQKIVFDFEYIIFGAVTFFFFLMKNAVTYLFERGKQE